MNKKHIHSFTVDVQVLENLNPETCNEFPNVNNVFAYCSCGVELSDSEIVERLNETFKSQPTPIDWQELRNAFFNECVDYFSNGDARVNFTPHNMFEWFKQKVERQRNKQ